MSNCVTNERQEALRAIVSLISKSEKAQQKLASTTWQHAMLCKNLKALRIALALLTKGADAKDDFSRHELQEALLALDSMRRKAKNTQAAFAPGTPQYTLQRNRLKAFRVAATVVRAKLHERHVPEERPSK